jgi:hypothetical protein
MNCVQGWCNLKMLKQAGRGHDPTGIEGTQPGELLVKCCACPWPKYNLPPDWEKEPPEKQWDFFLYYLTASECLYLPDGYIPHTWLRMQTLSRRLKPIGTTLETSHCSPVRVHLWITRNSPNIWSMQWRKTRQRCAHVWMPAYLTKNCIRLTTVLVSWPCTMLTRNKQKACEWWASAVLFVHIISASYQMEWGIYIVGKGPLLVINVVFSNLIDRFCYMDYLILMVILATTLTSFWISYDITCIWSKGFVSWAEGYGPLLHLPTTISLVFLVPKFHLPVHVKECWSTFSYNCHNYTGCTDGKGIEQIWAWLNCITYSVSMMTAGACWDMLDNFCSFNNWRKTKSLSTSSSAWLNLDCWHSFI